MIGWFARCKFGNLVTSTLILVLHLLLSFQQPSEGVLLPIQTVDRKDINGIQLTDIGAFGVERVARPTAPKHLHTGVDIDRPVHDYQLNQYIFPVATGTVISKRTDGPFAQLIIEHDIEGLLFWTVYEHIAGIEEDLFSKGESSKIHCAFSTMERNLDKIGWQFDHFHFEILKKRPIELKTIPENRERLFNSYTHMCKDQSTLDQHFYNPISFLEKMDRQLDYVAGLTSKISHLPLSFFLKPNRIMKYLLTILTLCIVITACQNEPGSSSSIVKQVKDDFSSPKSLFVDHVSSFTGGVISVASEIRLRLNKSIPDSLVGNSIEGVFNFEPSIAGTTSWEDNKTVVFKPDAALQNNQKYEAVANLKAIIPAISKEKEEFKFVFQTLLQNYEVAVGGLKLYDKDDLSRVKIEGEIQTADEVPLEKIQKMTEAAQSGNSLDISWIKREGNTFLFTIEEVSRTEEANEVTLKINGNSIGVDKIVDMEVEVPSIDDYKVVSSQIIRGNENYVSVLFSDPLDPRQNLIGLVTLTNSRSRPRVVIDLNELKIYPTQEMTATSTLTINKAIKNIAGYELKKDYSTNLRFSSNQAKYSIS